MEHPDIIEVRARKEIEVEADRTDVFVTMRGLSLVTGQSALNKAREVAALVDELKNFGLDEAQIRLLNVHAETQSGMLSKTSSALYSLKIADVTTAQLADVLGIVTGQKNATLNSLSWLYPNDEATRDSLLDECLQHANAQAQRIASWLGVRLLGVYQMNQNREDDGRHSTASSRSMADGMVVSRARMTSEDLGLAVSHSKTIEVEITIQYRVSGFDAAAMRE